MRYYTILLNGKENVAASKDGKTLFVLDEYKDMNSEELAMHVKKLIERCIEEHA